MATDTIDVMRNNEMTSRTIKISSFNEWYDFGKLDEEHNSRYTIWLKSLGCFESPSPTLYLVSLWDDYVGWYIGDCGTNSTAKAQQIFKRCCKLENAEEIVKYLKEKDETNKGTIYELL